jgi:UDP-N-acetylmuramoyl-L-alanyl-D-glutamate--2,6-diaminopimelate ligase
MKFSRLFQDTEVIFSDAEPDMDISGIEHDSRRVSCGFAFFCFAGARQDGHLFIDDAIRNGAKLLVSERDLAPSGKFRRVKVSDIRASLANVSARFYGDPSAKLKTVGITGTNGKTTTAYLVRSILESAGIESAILGTIAHRIGDRVIPAVNTTPDALEIQRLMAQALHDGMTGFVMEVSSHALDMKRVQGVRYDVAVFTNLTWDHLDYHVSFENYRKAKLRILDLLKPEGIAVINIDDPSARHFIEKAGSLGLEIVTCGLVQTGAKFSAKLNESSIKGNRFSMTTPFDEREINLRLIGEHNIYNALSAAAVGFALGIDMDKVAKGLCSVDRVNGRFDSVKAGQGFTVIVDYAHTPDALERALRTARKVTKGQLICVFGCGGDRDREKRPKMGGISSRLADHTIITSDNPRSEDPNSIIKEILNGVESGARYQIEPDREKAIAAAIGKARDDDTVIIAGKGHENYQVLGDRRIHFDDREVAERYIEEVLGDT